MTGPRSSTVEEIGRRPEPPARFVPHDPSNVRQALERSLRPRRAPLPRSCSRTEARSAVRQSIRLLVDLSTATHGLSVQRRFLADLGADPPEIAALDAFNRRVQTVCGSIIRCCVTGLVSISGPAIGPTSWHSLIIEPANARLADGTANPGAAVDLLPGEIADDLAAALALDRADMLQAAPFLVRGAGNAAALFVMAGLPYDSTAA